MIKTSLEVECLGCKDQFTIELDMSDPADRKKVEKVRGEGAYCPICDAKAYAGGSCC